MKARLFFLAACALFSGTGVIAQSAFDGVWCGDERIFVETEYGIGFNEHTVCDTLASIVQTADSFSTTLQCRNVYVVDVDNDGTQEVVEHNETAPFEFELRLIRPNVVEEYRDGARLGEFERCG